MDYNKLKKDFNDLYNSYEIDELIEIGNEIEKEYETED